MLIRLVGRWVEASVEERESSWISITQWGWGWKGDGEPDWLSLGERRERDGANKSEGEAKRDAGGLQPNPCLSQCALITLEQSEKHSATGWPSLTPFHSTGSGQMIWSELRCPERGSALYCTSRHRNTIIVQRRLHVTRDLKKFM